MSMSWVIDFNRFIGKAQVRQLRCPATALIVYPVGTVFIYEQVFTFSARGCKRTPKSELIKMKIVQKVRVNWFRKV